MANNIVNINNTDNNITVTNANQKVIVTDNNTGISVNVTNPNTSIVQVNTLGPQGNVGDQGATGPSGSIDTSLFVTTSSFNTFTGSYNTGSFTGSFTGSLFGTSSWATNAITSSYITSSNVRGPYGSNSVLSASYALSASWAPSTPPGGTVNQVQFNNGTTFAGSSNLTFDDDENELNTQRLKVVGRLILEGINSISGDDSPYLVGDNVSIILCNTSNGAIELDISLAAQRGRILIIKDTGIAASNNITFGSSTIDGGAFTAIDSNKESIIIVYDISLGTWQIIGSYQP